MSSTTLNMMLNKIIGLNECPDPDEAYEFSDPDGVRSGKSGWSFAPCQFDTQNNPNALLCLEECGFTDAEIQGVVHQDIDVKPLNARLKAHAAVINRYSAEQLGYCLNLAGNFGEKYGVPVADAAAMLMLADTVNQYGSLGAGSAAHLKALERPITAQDVLDMKLGWKYSETKRGHDDTVRRYNNVMTVVRREAA